MIYTKMTKKALIISYNAHKNQVDKSDIPYVFHPFHLAEQMDSEEAVIIALLHDVVEDTVWTMDDLEKQGFSSDVIDALKILTHSEDTDYLEYIRQIQKSINPYVVSVKLADLKHNCDLSRLDYVDKKTLKRIEKYIEAIKILTMPEGKSAEHTDCMNTRVTDTM